ncbi:hypothetical protein N7456_011968 [Penicillium angulare]|uniref:6-phosphogluconolactonase n=1 Tax=Penicillium angulare TaxID=116970 RepID=A0A9W9K176_9EURO|nr:hypothetical protein N7456_011968 [Penicillium angulare]
MRLQTTTTFLSTLLFSTSTLAARTNLNVQPEAKHANSNADTSSHLWVTHYNGNVYTLAFDGDKLSISDTQKTCGGMPSWLTYDSESKIVYCSDENGTADATTHGTLSAYSVGAGAKLKEIAQTNTIGGGVNSVIYEGEGNDKYIAIAHYEGSAVSTFSLPLKPNSHAKQELHFTMSHKGATSQQDAPHPHEVFLDPTGSFLISPDLGADLLRIYNINPHTGHLKTCPPLNVTFGSGPRHGLFWTDGTDGNNSTNGAPTHERQVAAVGKTVMYLVNEIGGTMNSFDVSYARSGCLDLQVKQTLVPYTGDMPDGATPAEIRMIGDKFYVSVRSDGGFDGNDSIVELKRGKNEKVSVLGKTDAWGVVPRTMVINRRGDLVAIGNQASSNVAIVRRDRETGDLGEKVAVLNVGEPGKPGTATGLSSVIWAE